MAMKLESILGCDKGEHITPVEDIMTQGVNRLEKSLKETAKSVISKDTYKLLRFFLSLVEITLESPSLLQR